ncbi:class I SAM-dependent methyltransferase [Gammaproteobacteria bacterium]|nr:class I SAM-dependent methyltransferase [Gammaproteobacteria bacterium]
MLPHSEASENNKGPILVILKEVFAKTRRVLEIGSGTGQHAVYFAEHLPHLTWQPSDRPGAVQWVEQRLEIEGPDNVASPLILDVNDHPWSVEADGVFSANTFHIMSWREVEQFFTGVGELLSRSGTLCVYGPFRYDGGYTSESNARFDRSLRAQAPHMGIRDFEAVDRLAEAQGLKLLADYSMPANNQSLVWRKIQDINDEPDRKDV